MKPQLLKLSTNSIHSFSAREDHVPYINNRWHYHPEIELLFIKQGTGTQFIGDHIRRFRSGDLVMIGSNLPHYCKFDDAYFEENSGLKAQVYVIHFRENFWGETFLNLPENKSIKNLLERAKRGLLITGKIEKTVAEIVRKLPDSIGGTRLLSLLEALHYMSGSNELATLSSIGFNPAYEQTENDRIHAIYEFSLANFKRKILMQEVAEVAHVSVNYFCRYFKSRTSKTYSRFINEIRVGYACKLLIENKISIKQICSESGFYNFASFHQYFKAITGKSPLHYQRAYLNDPAILAQIVSENS